MDPVQLLQKNRIRVTPLRLAVVTVLEEVSVAMDAKAIYDRLKQQDQSIGIASVYRNLAMLEKSGIVSRQPFLNQNSGHYRLTGVSRGHVVCSRCGKTETLDVTPELEHFQETVSVGSKFATKDQDLYIIADCRNKQQCD